MRHSKQFPQLNKLSPGRDVGYIEKRRALPGVAAELKSACEMQALLRDYTYHLIGLGNTFRDIARYHGKFHGSAWRSYRGVCGAKLKALMEQTNSMQPYDVDSILSLERAIEALAETLMVPSKVVQGE
jgi:hypothetical protein